MATDPNRDRLLRVVGALGEIAGEFTFVGGATVGILVSDPAAPGVRPTVDVDVVVRTESLADYHSVVAAKLKARGFTECSDSGAPICAWKIGDIRVDVMPTSSSVFGFTNEWFDSAVTHAETIDLGDTSVRVIPPPSFSPPRSARSENAATATTTEVTTSRTSLR